MRVAAMPHQFAHDAIDDPTLGQPRTACDALIALVGVDRALITADEVIPHRAVGHLGTGHDGDPDQLRALIHRDMGLVTEPGFVAALGPVRVGIERAALAGSAVRITRRLHAGLKQSGIEHGPALDQQSTPFQLPVEFGEQAIAQLQLRQLRAKAADGRVVGHLFKGAGVRSSGGRLRSVRTANIS